VGQRRALGDVQVAHHHSLAPGNDLAGGRGVEELRAQDQVQEASHRTLRAPVGRGIVARNHHVRAYPPQDDPLVAEAGAAGEGDAESLHPRAVAHQQARASHRVTGLGDRQSDAGGVTDRPLQVLRRLPHRLRRLVGHHQGGARQAVAHQHQLRARAVARQGHDRVLRQRARHQTQDGGQPY
jgi:hypothetical protein